MAKVNIVLEGRCKGRNITLNKNHINISGDLDKSNISSYTIIDEINKDQYSFWKGALGVVAGIGGKNKNEYLIAIEWTYPKNSSNNKSLILLDEKYYKVFVASMF